MRSNNAWTLYGVFLAAVGLAWLIPGPRPAPENALDPVDFSELPELEPGAPEGEPILPTPQSAGVRQLPEGIAPFSPPGDGKLTEAHLEMFTRVARAARRTASGRVDEVTLQWAEARAAESLGYDPKGYRWARARIHLALIQHERREQLETTAAMRDGLVAQIEELRAEANTEAQRAIIDQELDDVLAEMQSAPPSESEVERHNRLLVQANLESLRNAMGLGDERLGPALRVIDETPDGLLEPETQPSGAPDAPPSEGDDEEEELLVPFEGEVGESWVPSPHADTSSDGAPRAEGTEAPENEAEREDIGAEPKEPKPETTSDE